MPHLGLTGGYQSGILPGVEAVSTGTVQAYFAQCMVLNFHLGLCSFLDQKGILCLKVFLCDCISLCDSFCSTCKNSC